MKSIADVVSAAGLAIYAEVALAIFFIVFAAIGLRLLVPNPRWDDCARLPLDDDSPSPRPSRPADTHE